MRLTTMVIEGTFDIARGRNSLRTHTARQRWPPVFVARATAALTALGELILSSQPEKPVVVQLNIIDRGHDPGVQFTCNIEPFNHTLPRLRKAQENLARATDDLDVHETANGIRISAHMLAERWSETR